MKVKAKTFKVGSTVEDNVYGFGTVTVNDGKFDEHQVRVRFDVKPNWEMTNHLYVSTRNLRQVSNVNRHLQYDKDRIVNVGNRRYSEKEKIAMHAIDRAMVAEELLKRITEIPEPWDKVSAESAFKACITIAKGYLDQLQETDIIVADTHAFEGF